MATRSLTQPEYGDAVENLYGILGTLAFDAMIENLKSASRASAYIDSRKEARVEGVLRQIVTAQKEVQNLMREMEKDWGLD
jgi:hypothetical protein